MGVDPSGNATLINVLSAGGILGLIAANIAGWYGYAKNQSSFEILQIQAAAFFVGFITGAASAAAVIYGGAAIAAQGIPLWMGQLAIGKIFGTVGLIGASAAVIDANRNGDSIDKAFAWGAFGTAVGGNILGPFSLVRPAITRNGPMSAFARSLQGSDDYPGVDTFVDGKVLKGTILVGADASEGGPGYFFSTVNNLVQFGHSKSGYWGSLQVKPGGPNMAFRSKLRLYIVEQDIDAAFGTVGANRALGDGGSPQIVLREGAAIRPISDSHGGLYEFPQP